MTNENLNEPSNIESLDNLEDALPADSAQENDDVDAFLSSLKNHNEKK